MVRRSRGNTHVSAFVTTSRQLSSTLLSPMWRNIHASCDWKLTSMYVRKWFGGGKRGVDYSQSESASSSTRGWDSFVDKDVFVTPVTGESDFAITDSFDSDCGPVASVSFISKAGFDAWSDDVLLSSAGMLSASSSSSSQRKSSSSSTT